MNFKRLGTIGAIALVGGLVLSPCAANEGGTPAETGDAGSSLTGTLVGAGSSAVGAAQETWIAEFQTANEGVTITYDPSGSGAGRETFLAGGSDFAGTDRAFNDEEVAAGGFASCTPESGIVQLPLYISPIAVIFNLEGIESLNMDADTIAGIFAGTITTWNDPKIAEQNEGVELPATAITAVHRSDDSGTTDNFTDYLAQAAPSVWTYEADGVWPIESGEAAQGTSGVVDAAIVDRSPLVEGRPDFDLSIELDRTPDAAAYPVVLVAYLVGCETYVDAEQGALVKEYFTYMASPEGQAAAAAGAGSAPISESLFEAVTAAIAVIK